MSTEQADFNKAAAAVLSTIEDDLSHQGMFDLTALTNQHQLNLKKLKEIRAEMVAKRDGLAVFIEAADKRIKATLKAIKTLQS